MHMKSYRERNNFECEIIQMKYLRYFIFNVHKNGVPRDEHIVKMYNLSL